MQENIERSHVSPGDERADEPILRPGDTCWRTADASRVSLIIDAHDYFRAARDAILRAEHSVYLIGWDFDLRIELDPSDEDDEPRTLKDLLVEATRGKPNLHIFLLKWDGAMVDVLVRQVVPVLALQWLRSDQIHFTLDSEHPPGATHHQKIAVIDDTVAFCGGIDMTHERWDSRGHEPHDRRRRTPSGSYYGPWHDVTAALEGDAAKALGDLARMRWHHATGHWLAKPDPNPDVWPPRLRAALEDVEVGIARTVPEQQDEDAVHEIEKLYVAAIRSAKRTIYLESQYFVSDAICGAIMERLREPGGPEVVVINPRTAETKLEAEVMDSARSLMLEDVLEADREGRFGIYYPVNDVGEGVYVHAKVLIVDDRFLRIGSSNVNNRSMGFDTECDVAIEARGENDRDAVRETVTGFRDDLLSEHLDVSCERLRDEIEAQDGSLLAAVEALRRDDGRTVHRIEPEELNQFERAIAESQALDPDENADHWDRFKHAYKKAVAPHHIQVAVGASILVGILGVRAVAALARRL